MLPPASPTANESLRDAFGIAASLSGSYLSARLRRPLTEPSLKESIAQQSLRDAFGIAASLSDFLCMLPPASPTANESLRDAFGIL
jgi:hypothetical protein